MNENSSSSITIKFNLRIVCLVLLAVIVTMLALWRPWHHASSVTRKITVSGDATVKATPDEFVFYPTFDRSGTDVAAMKNDLNTFGTKLVGDMKKLGVAENDVTLDSSSYSNYYNSSDGTQTITLSVTIKAPNKDLAQKVQDYLAGTDAKGQLTPQAQFSTAKQKELENTARLQAIADARKKAGQEANNVSAKLGKVISVSDNASTSGCGGGMCPYLTNGTNLDTGTANTKSLPVTAGTGEVSQTVQVVFELD